MISTDFAFEVPPDNTGVIVRRKVIARGTVSITSVRVGVAILLGSFNVKVFALEMVNIPLSNVLFVGDRDNITNGFEDGITGKPFLVAPNTIIMFLTMCNLEFIRYNSCGTTNNYYS